MTKVRFSGFPAGEQVTISASKDGVSRGPLTVSAWKQSDASASFNVHSVIGDDSSTVIMGINRLTPGSLIEMVAPGGLFLVIDGFEGFSTNDPRRLTITTDFGERYDAQHLEHPHLPTGFTTRDPTGAQMGIYPGFGTDMSGNQQLTEDYDADAGPIGTCDRTVTCTVSDGTISAQQTFTVRLIHPYRYYTDTDGLTYATADGGGRTGCLFVSRDGDFTGAPPEDNANGIHYQTIADGDLTQTIFAPRTNGVCGIFLKAGQTFTPIEEFGYYGSGASMLNSFGTANGGMAILSAEKRNAWGIDRTFFREQSSGYRPYRFANIEFFGSDYDVSDVTWREWWNELNYTGKQGTITENTATLVDPGSNYNGAILTNADNSAYVQVIRDDDNGDGTGTLICRQVVTGSSAQAGDQAYFADGETLTDVSDPANSVVFDAAGSRQDRTRKIPGGKMIWTGDSRGVLMDNCVFKGGSGSVGTAPKWSVFSDILVTDYWNYGFGETEPRGHVLNGVVVAQPSNYQGEIAYFSSSAVDGNRNILNSTRSDIPNQPVENNIRHSAWRFGFTAALGMYKCISHSYGGHGSLHQPGLRIPTSAGAEGLNYMHFHGCAFSGGHIPFQIQSPPRSDTPPYTPRGIKIDECWARADFSHGEAYLFYSQYTNVGINDTLFSWPAGVTISKNGGDLKFIEWGDGGGYPYVESPDVNAVPPYVENCQFEYLSNNSFNAMLGFDTEMRENGANFITYSGNTVNIDETKFNSIASF